MVNSSNHWTRLYYAYCMLAILHTAVATEYETKVKQSDVLQETGKLIDNPTNSSSEGVLLSSYVTAFYVWSRDYKEGKVYQKILPDDSDAVKKLVFAAQRTVIIFHGFRGDGLQDWIKELRDKLLLLENVNVISVDWPAGTAWFLFSYYTAANHVSNVGADTATLLKHLETYKGLDMKSVHLIGHNLGAHAAGHCGKSVIKNMNKKIARISGVEPAGLTFHRTNKSKRLDKSDASYVDIIHTNSCDPGTQPWTCCYGLNENIGHADFWPNGGEYQPYCNKATKEVSSEKSDDQSANHRDLESTLQHNPNLTIIADKDAVVFEYGCDHEMAYKYFIESLDYRTDDTYFLARPCHSWPLYKDGLCSCGESAQYMGYNSFQGVHGVFYLKTNSSSPFAIRDTYCPPAGGPNQSRSLLLIVSSTSASVLVAALIITTVYCIIKRSRRKREEAQCGLVVETDSLSPPDVECLCRDEFSGSCAGQCSCSIPKVL